MQVSVDKLSKSFGKRLLFENLSHEFVPNEVNVILGESGSGKTTLLNIIGLFECADSGTVKYDGSPRLRTVQDADQKTDPITCGLYLPGYPNLRGSHSRRKSQTGFEVLLDPEKAHESIIDSMLKRVGLDGFQPRTSKELSGGEKQRVAIARALISGKKLILADEPTGALDEENSRSVIHLIQDINKSERCTILMVTHSMLVAGEFAHRFC